MTDSGVRDVDIVLTTRELARMIKQAGIDFRSLPDEKMDAPLGISTGAADIFAVTGGVMEAALRTAYEIVTGDAVPLRQPARRRPSQGLDGVKEASVTIDGHQCRTGRSSRAPTLKVAVAHGLGNAQKVIDRVKSGEAELPLRRGHDLPRRLHRRRRPAAPHLRRGARGRIRGDLRRRTRTASCASRHENPDVCKLYEEYLGAPLRRDLAPPAAHPLLRERPRLRRGVTVTRRAAGPSRKRPRATGAASGVTGDETLYLDDR